VAPKQLIASLAIASLLAAPAAPVFAKGCLKGAAVGAVAGHVAGHHAVIGAVGGCIAGHHLANQKAKQAAALKQQQNAAPAGALPAPPAAPAASSNGV
jgi:hypothetical protein